MPGRYNAQPRGYGGYSRDFDRLYEAESQLPPWMTGLSEGVSTYMEMKARRDAAKKAEEKEQEVSDREFKRANMAANIQIATANAGIEASMAEAQEKERAKTDAARTASVIRGLMKRFALDGNANDAAELVAMGVPAASLNAVRPKLDPDDPQVLARKRRAGTLEADKAAGVGAFAPKAPPAKPASLTPVRAGQYAKSAVQSWIGEVLESEPSFQTAQEIIQKVKMDPLFEQHINDTEFQRALQGEAQRAIAAAKAARMRQGGGRGSSMGARTGSIMNSGKKP